MRKYSNDSKSLPNNFNINHTNTVVFKYLHIQIDGEYLLCEDCDFKVMSPVYQDKAIFLATPPPRPHKV